MRVAVWPVNYTGCGHFRQLWPGRAIRRAGLAEVIEDAHGPPCSWSASWEGLDYPPPEVELVAVGDYDADVVVVQRPALRQRVDVIPHLQAQGITVVVDVDDRFDAIPESNVAWDSYQGLGTNAENVDRACRLADVVTASTPSLVRRYGYGKGRLARNLVPESYLSVTTSQTRDSVGWAGQVGTHPGDLESTGGRIARTVERFGWHFHVVGSGEGVREALGLRGRLAVFGWQPFSDYPAAMASLEVGVVPLCASRFNAGKSWLKMSEFAALGVPVVASETPENVELHRSGVGVLAGSPAQWERRLRQLLASPAYRADLAGRGREAMRSLTYEAHALDWFQAWSPSRATVPAA